MRGMLHAGEEKEGRYATSLQFLQATFLYVYLMHCENVIWAVYVQYNHIFSGFLVYESYMGI
jgi:hypothetical protein